MIKYPAWLGVLDMGFTVIPVKYIYMFLTNNDERKGIVKEFFNFEAEFKITMSVSIVYWIIRLLYPFLKSRKK